jgi:putative membrane protein
MPRIPVKAFLTHVLHGAVIGSANVIPGVSGGTMALIFGIYEDLIGSLSAGFSAFLEVIRLNVAGARAKLAEIDWVLIGGLAAGVMAILVVGGKIVPYLLDTHPQESRGVFFGLIVGSLAIPWLRMSGVRARHVLIALAAGITAFMLVGLPPRDAGSPGVIAIFMTAVVAITAMILPGVSGAHLLLVLGMYTPTFRAIDERDLLFIAVFALGAGIGLGMFAKFLNWLLARYHDATMAALIGLMAGSLRALWPWVEADNTLRLPGEADSFGLVILLAIGGFVAVSLLTWWSHRRHRAKAGT